ncbi:alpha/beta hydrolase [Mycolicibacterium peregrinum]|uniref:alpha/beta hydrolase n=1 Tax=Mycolicibacterium peregrinum TaxID=43304 RepID=UPI0009ED2E13
MSFSQRRCHVVVTRLKSVSSTGCPRTPECGSPGIEAFTPQDLHAQAGHVYAMEAPDDPIRGVYDAKAVLQGIPILGTYLNNDSTISARTQPPTPTSPISPPPPPRCPRPTAAR